MRVVLLMLLLACGSKSNPGETKPAPPAEPAPGGDCVKSGCSGTLCVEAGKEVITTCEYKAEYGCYQSATCGRQPSGDCGWKQTPELKACLANPPPAK